MSHNIVKRARFKYTCSHHFIVYKCVDYLKHRDNKEKHYCVSKAAANNLTEIIISKISSILEK